DATDAGGGRRAARTANASVALGDGPSAATGPDAAGTPAGRCPRREDAVALVGPEPRSGDNGGLLPQRRRGRCRPPLRRPDAYQLRALGDPRTVHEASRGMERYRRQPDTLKALLRKAIRL